MDKSKIMQRLVATFLEELEEHVRNFNQELLILEKNPPVEERAERLKTLFRTVHSLKGAARSVNVDLIEGACHWLEEILTRVRDGHEVLSPELTSLFFAVADALEEAGMRLREQQDLADAPLAALLPRLEQAANGARAEAVKPAAPKALPRAPAPVLTAARPAAVEPMQESGIGAASVRVPAEKLDSLLARVGELHIAQRRVEARVSDLVGLQDFVAQWRTEWKRVEQFFARARRAVGDAHRAAGLPRRAALVLQQASDNFRKLDKTLDGLAAAMASDARLFERVARPLDDEVRRVRMLPFTDACAGLDRMVRDLAQGANKEVELRIEGGAVELDRSILEGLKDPLRHLVRNALDHGVEIPADRARAGKPRQGTITVAAALHGAQVEVHVRDDGRGIDLEAIRTQARRRKIDEPADEHELARLIFHPGFSTAGIITDISGRGVGLDVVKNRVESLHGTVDLAFTAGKATCFTLTVPLTLTTLRAVLVRAGGQTCAFAGTNVQKLTKIAAADIHSVAGRPTLSFDGAPLPVAPLGSILDPNYIQDTTPDKMPVLIVASGTMRMAFLVDEHLAEQEILIKNLGVRIRRAPFVSGATLLPSGQVALVLNAANLVRSVLRQGGAFPRRTDQSKTSAPVIVRKRLLIVEDSMTTRALMKSILEAAGYDVVTAADGQAGWRLLQDTSVDLVVSDVDMPNMDGFELTAAARASKKHAELPIVLVTARESEPDKTRGIEVGADAYLVKSAFDQRNLLETIRQML
jgi:two-component system chemotaxis sensor kinase CheA